MNISNRVNKQIVYVVDLPGYHPEIPGVSRKEYVLE